MKTKGTIFCIHGNSSSSQIFDAWLRFENYDVITIDLPGHGRNQDYSSEDDFSFNSYCNFLIDLANKIEGEIIVFGHSLGGHLAISIAKFIKNIKALIVMGTAPLKKPINTSEAFMPVKELNVFFKSIFDKAELYKAADKLILKDSNKTMFINSFIETNPLTREKIATEIIDNNILDEYTLFKTLNIPKYLLVGENDCMINKDYLAHFKEGNNKCEVINIKNCGHYPVDATEDIKTIIKDVAQAVF
ncbi:alpha/beta fold hydrolase [Winogradskyella immobilis]|uniref:Alpha/beta hydrolase n=1 Tax=Winogradskyella immobilis TaxID=2816852 RepID=A0ABS8EJR1_9FLAO|nr:alpha/beta hydrolase [Winogradskyella immobilis]MCC1483430.1 alpha/beta hydrolase [Winogradskyella immobilis]MCG0015524.1 alpha/beta hydrolase [Winogradskyella immobilis]